MATHNVPTITTDRQRLPVSSREMVPQEARFLKEIEAVASGYTTLQRRQEKDWTDSWMGRGDAVYGGVKLCSRAMLGIAFYAALAHFVGIDTIGAAETLLRSCW
jgi:hypothetical protein